MPPSRYVVLAAMLLLVTAPSNAEIDNVTIEVSYDLPSQQTFIDNTPQTSGIFTNLNFPYIATESGTDAQLFGLVNFADFLQLGLSTNGDTVTANMTQQVTEQTPRAAFLMPFTIGSHSDIESREDEIQQGFASASSFLGYPAPNFGYTLSQDKLIRTRLSYETSRFQLDGFDGILAGGIHTLQITNNGTTENNTLRIGIELR